MSGVTIGLFMDFVGHDAGEDLGRVPAPGDSVVTVGKKGFCSGYLIRAVREVRRRDPTAPPRFALRVVRIPIDKALQVEQACWQMSWYPRGRRVADLS